MRKVCHISNNAGYRRDTQRWLFGGKELDRMAGLDQYDFEARMYDPATIRFTRMDDMAETYWPDSPYAYCLNNPIGAKDIDGNVVIYINGQHGGDGGSVEYWGSKIVSELQNKIGDYKAIYYDGACGGWGNTAHGIKHIVTFNGQLFVWHESENTNIDIKYRIETGINKGYSEAHNIIKSLDPGETIKFVSHSMGGAYTKGFIQGMQLYVNEYNSKNPNNKIDLSSLIEFEVDFAPFQPTKQAAIDGVRTIVIQHRYDIVAGYKAMPGADNFVTHKNKSWWKFWNRFTEHTISSFSDDIRQYVPKSQGTGSN